MFRLLFGELSGNVFSSLIFSCFEGNHIVTTPSLPPTLQRKCLRMFSVVLKDTILEQIPPTPSLLLQEEYVCKCWIVFVFKHCNNLPSPPLYLKRAASRQFCWVFSRQIKLAAGYQGYQKRYWIFPIFPRNRNLTEVKVDEYKNPFFSCPQTAQ